MLRYGGDEWFAEFCRLVESGPGPQLSATVGYIITDGGDSADDRDGADGRDGLRYTIHIHAGTVKVQRDIEPDATVVFTQSRATAAAVAGGQLSAYHAFMTGKILVSGDPTTLIGTGEFSQWLASATEPLRSMTDYSIVVDADAGSDTAGK